MSLKVHSQKYLPVTSDEEYFDAATSLLQKYSDSLLSEAYALDKLGKIEKSALKYEAIQFLTLIHYYVRNIKSRIERSAFLYSCNTDVVTIGFNIECVRKNLLCLSTKYGIPYESIFDEILDIYQVELVTDLCIEGCQGIGNMAIDEDDDEIAFIVGSCEDLGIDILGDFNDDFSDEFNN